MIKQIYLFANMGHLDQLPKSGGQSSARRVMKGLQESGFEIVPIRRHRNELEGKWKHKMEALTFAIIDPYKIVVRMLFQRRKDAAFLHLTYAGPLVPYELFLSILVRMMGYKSLIYLKGGQVLDFYANGSRLHRWMFKKTMDLQTKVFFEGMESLKLVEKISKTPLVYFPNFVFDNQIPDVLPEKPKDTIGLLYFGRITPDKNVDVVIKAFNILNEKYGDVYLYVIGGSGFSKSYVTQIDQLIESSPYKNHITRMGLTPFAKIKEIMQTTHMFVFPSKERCEGHSNSLNEAMGQGLIPVVSDYHFNGTIVGDDRLLVDGYNPQSYAYKIAYIRENFDMEKLAIQMRDRVRNNYSSDIVNNRIYEELKKL